MEKISIIDLDCVMLQSVAIFLLPTYTPMKRNATSSPGGFYPKDCSPTGPYL